MNIVTTIGIDFAKKHAFTRTSPAVCGFPLQPVLLAEGRKISRWENSLWRVPPHVSRAGGSPVTILFLGGKSRCPASVRRQASGRPGGPVSLGLGMGLVRLFFQSAERVSGA